MKDFNLKQNVEANLNLELRKKYVQQVKQNINSKEYTDKAIDFIVEAFIL